MKRIPKILVRDYALIALGFFAFFTLMRPWGMRNSVSDNLWYLQSLGCSILIFLIELLSELLASNVFRLPCDYSRDWPYQLKRKCIFYPSLIIIFSAVIGTYFTILEHGVSNWYYFWQDENCHFSLKWYLNSFCQNIIWCIFVAIYCYFVDKSRIKEYKIQELLSLNTNLENTADSEIEKLEEVKISGESREFLSVSPSDILYIESVANYLNILYFSDGELKQKRIRNTLKNVEELLADYGFLLHCHRAFLVNTRFITHVDGNAAGCQLHLFSTERTIPVSKANIEALRKSLS